MPFPSLLLDGVKKEEEKRQADQERKKAQDTVQVQKREKIVGNKKSTEVCVRGFDLK